MTEPVTIHRATRLEDLAWSSFRHRKTPERGLVLAHLATEALAIYVGTSPDVPFPVEHRDKTYVPRGLWAVRMGPRVVIATPEALEALLEPEVLYPLAPAPAFKPCPHAFVAETHDARGRLVETSDDPCGLCGGLRGVILPSQAPSAQDSMTGSA